MELFFKALAVILAGVAAYFLWQGNSDGGFVAAVLGAVAFFLSVRFQVKARNEARFAEEEEKRRRGEEEEGREGEREEEEEEEEEEYMDEAVKHAHLQAPAAGENLVMPSHKENDELLPVDRRPPNTENRPPTTDH